MFYNHNDNPNRQRIQKMFGGNNTSSILKSEESNILGFTNDNIEGGIGLTFADAFDFEKGRTPMPLGAHANWGGQEYLKTASGWKPVGKLRGHVKANHDHLHNNEEKDKDHHAMTMDAGKLDESTWTKKHGAGLHAKYKAVHDYLHKEKGEKLSADESEAADRSIQHFITKYEGEIKAGDKKLEDLISETKKLISENKKGNVGYAKKDKILNGLLKHFESKNSDDHGIEVGKNYQHEEYGKVKVTGVDKNEGDKSGTISHIVHFEHHNDVAGYAGKDGKVKRNESQGINGFRHGTTGKYDGKPAPIDSKDAHEKRGFTEDKGDVDVTGKGEKIPDISKLSNAEVKAAKKLTNSGGKHEHFSDKEITEEMKKRYSSMQEDEKKDIDSEGIPNKVKEHFKSVSKDTNFSFVNMLGNIWRRDNKDGKIIAHEESPKSFVLPGGSAKEIALSGASKSLFETANKRFGGKLDEKSVAQLADKIAASDKEKETKVEHVAEALMYEHEKQEGTFGKFDFSDIESGLTNPNYSFPNLERKDEIGILSKEAKSAMNSAKEIFKKVGALDSSSKSLIKVLHSRYLYDKTPEEQLSAINDVLEDAVKYHTIDQKFNSGEKSTYPVHIAAGIKKYMDKMDGTDGKVDHVKSKQMVEGGLAEYKKSPAVKKARMKKQIEDNIKMHENGLKHIGMGMDETTVHAGKEFLKKIA